MRYSFSCLTIIFLCTDLGHAVLAEQRTAENPSARYSFALAYDESRQHLVLFGGFMRGAYLGDTWEWDGQSWQQISASGPSARAGHKLVFDSKRKTVLLDGGFVGAGPTAELWEWMAKCGK